MVQRKSVIMPLFILGDPGVDSETSVVFSNLINLLQSHQLVYRLSRAVSYTLAHSLTLPT